MSVIYASEHQKMLAGQPYDPLDSELVSARTNPCRV